MNTYNNMKTNNAINKNLIYVRDQGDSTYFGPEQCLPKV